MNSAHIMWFLLCCFCAAAGTRALLSKQRTTQLLMLLLFQNSVSEPLGSLLHMGVRGKSSPSTFGNLLLKLERIYFSSCFYQRNSLQSLTLFCPLKTPGILPGRFRPRIANSSASRAWVGMDVSKAAWQEVGTWWGCCLVLACYCHSCCPVLLIF